MSEPAINCSPEIIADLERKIVALQSKLERAELSEANLSVWKRSAEISIEAQAATISRLTADNEALRETNEKLGRALFWFSKYPEYRPNPDLIAQWSADLDAAKPFILARAALGDRP